MAKSKRSDGRYAVQIYLGKTEDGKRNYKTVYGATKKEANAKANDVKAMLGKGIDISAQSDTFKEWNKRWLSMKKRTVSASQYTVYSSVCKYLDNLIGDREISKIRLADVQSAIDEIADKNPHTKKPSSSKLLKQMKSAAVQIFDMAVQNRVIDFNPANAVQLDKRESTNKRRALTQEEQQWITDTPHRAQLPAMLMMYAGLRRGEVIPLTWNDIDLINKTITVNKSVEMIDGKSREKPTTKTVNSQRVIDIPQKLVEFLLIKKRESKSLLVCTNAHGSMYNSTSWKRLWESYIKDLNFKYGELSFNDAKKYNGIKPKSKFDPGGIEITIPKFTAHWLRHTFATLLYLSGVDVLTAKEQLGHSDIKTTLQIYTHLDKQFKRKSMSKLDDYLENKSQCKSDASQA